MTMLLAFSLITLGLAVYFFGEVATYPARQQRLSVKRAAGYGRARLTGPYLAAKGALAIVGIVLALVFGVANAPLLGIVFAPMLGGVGFFVPDAFLTMATRSRRESIRAELPDALDLLA